ncbi:hypothetical protein Sjap_016583 [Stephania japonica]|uniref:Protein kinase domain-containing protein n=1 Tax=Stephania japonica TaxID=461633 RepID=A0AAP0ILA2_9MAGN
MGCVISKTSPGAGRETAPPSGDGASTASVLGGGVGRWWNRGGGKEEDRRRKGEIAVAAAAAIGKPSPGHALRVQLGWPEWLSAVAGDAIRGWTPRTANTFEKIDKIGQGTYSNVYKARDLMSGRIVALKKVRFDNLEADSVKFMAREILVLRSLDHPNVIKLEGLVTSRMSSSLYLVFKYMEHDLAGLVATPGIKFTDSQIKCYMKQLLLGLEHCHNQGVLHRDIKGSNLLIDDEGVLKIADFGLAAFYDPSNIQPMTSRVVTLWYRPPELLLGATFYGIGVDLWSAGCILAELLAGKPILPGRTEVEQLHKIFKLCGSPSEEYWKKSKLPHATIFKPQQPYERCIAEKFSDFPPAALSLVETLLSVDPDERGNATAALNSDSDGFNRDFPPIIRVIIQFTHGYLIQFFTTKPYACEPSSLPKFPPSKELDVKLREEETRRKRSSSRRGNVGDDRKRTQVHDQGIRAFPAPEANAELRPNINRRRRMPQPNTKSKSEKFPPPHQDGSIGFPMNTSKKGPVSFGVPDTSVASSLVKPSSPGISHSGFLGNPIAARRRTTGKATVA